MYHHGDHILLWRGKNFLSHFTSFKFNFFFSSPSAAFYSFVTVENLSNKENNYEIRNRTRHCRKILVIVFCGVTPKVLSVILKLKLPRRRLHVIQKARFKINERIKKITQLNMASSELIHFIFCYIFN